MQQTIYVEPKITGTSLVGVLGSAPFSYGNYFWMGEYYVVNMWAENLEYLLKKGKIKETDKLEAVQVGQKILITDKRIPKKFLNTKLCFNGCGGTPEEYQILYREAFGESDNCYCNAAHDYVSYRHDSCTVGPNRPNYSKGDCRCCGREMFFRYYRGNSCELTQKEFTLLWNAKD